MNAFIDALRFSKDIKLVMRPATSSFSKLYPTIHTNKIYWSIVNFDELKTYFK